MSYSRSYFRLFPESIHVSGPYAGALYLLLQRRVFALDPLRDRVLATVESSRSVEEAASQAGLFLPEVEDFLAALQDLEAGCFMEHPCFVEKVRWLNPIEEITFFRPAPRINTLHIVLSGCCAQDCMHCRPGKVTPRLQPCIGCWRTAGKKRQTLTAEETEKAVREAAVFGCRSLMLHAGDLDSIEELVIDTVTAASENGYESVEIMTGSPVSGQLIEQFAELRIVPAFQLYSNRASVHDAICGREGSFLRLMDNLAQMRNVQVPFKLIYVFTGEDSDPRDIVADMQSWGPVEIYSDRLISDDERVSDFIYGFDFLIPPDINRYVLKLRSLSCLQGRLTLGCDGIYHPCPLLYEYELGHVRETTVREIFEKEEIQKFWHGGVADASCPECEFRFACHHCEAMLSHLGSTRYICGYNPLSGQWEAPADTEPGMTRMEEMEAN